MELGRPAWGGESVPRWQDTHSPGSKGWALTLPLPPPWADEVIREVG